MRIVLSCEDSLYISLRYVIGGGFPLKEDDIEKSNFPLYRLIDRSCKLLALSRWGNIIFIPEQRCVLHITQSITFTTYLSFFSIK